MPRSIGRAFTARLGLPTLLLASLAASAVTTATAAPTPAPAATSSTPAAATASTLSTTITVPTTTSKKMTVSGHHDTMNCDPIRFEAAMR